MGRIIEIRKFTTKAIMDDKGDIVKDIRNIDYGNFTVEEKKEIVTQHDILEMGEEVGRKNSMVDRILEDSLNNPGDEKTCSYYLLQTVNS